MPINCIAFSMDGRKIVRRAAASFELTSKRFSRSSFALEEEKSSTVARDSSSSRTVSSVMSAPAALLSVNN